MDPENMEGFDVDSEEELRSDAMYPVMLGKWQRWACLCLQQFWLSLFRTIQDFYHHKIMTTPKCNKVTDITSVIGQQQSEQISFIVETIFLTEGGQKELNWIK